jgi:hypothetical protein
MPLAAERSAPASARDRARTHQAPTASGTKEETGPGCGPVSLHGLCDLEPRPPRRVDSISGSSRLAVDQRHSAAVNDKSPINDR